MLFFILRKDSRQFIPLPKECLSGYEQALACIQYCRIKGLLPVQIKKAKYVPHWLFRIMIAFAFCAFFAAGMLHEYQKPEEVFWFDFEGWDLETDYIHILEGMAALAEGSAIEQVENIRVDTTKVDWEKGHGTLTVTLDYNGETLIYPMKVRYDWIDSDVLNIYNDLLNNTDSAEYFYAMGDDGQGVIIFFCSEDWAKHFEKMTNIKLEKL